MFQNTNYTTYEWDFGDILGGTGTGKNPVYTYLALNGEYTVTLTVTDSNSNVTTFQNTVGTGNKENSTIPDTTPPVVSFMGDTILLLVKNTLADPGVVITDDRDNITTWDTSGNFYKAFPTGKANLIGIFDIVYKARDKAGNEDSVTRIVHVIDTIPPIVQLLGPIVFCFTEGDSIDWTDPGVSIGENYWSDPHIAITQERCDTSIPTKPGIYKLIRYEAVDGSGNAGYSGWRYWIIKRAGDTSACVLTDSLKDTCQKIDIITAFNSPYLSTELKIHPNPASNQVVISLNERMGRAVNVRLLDMSGKEILLHRQRSGMQGDKIELNTSTVTDGLYLIEVSTATDVVTKRISIAR